MQDLGDGETRGKALRGNSSASTGGSVGKTDGIAEEFSQRALSAAGFQFTRTSSTVNCTPYMQLAILKKNPVRNDAAGSQRTSRNFETSPLSK